MDVNSFVTSLGTSILTFMIFMVLFAWLSTRPENVCVYYPNRILKNMDPWEQSGSKTRNPFAWIREALASSEQDVISMSGVDSAVYFLFLNTVFGICILSGILLLPILLPVASTERYSTGNNTFNDLDKITMAHLKEGSPRLWVFVIACYWVSLVSYFLLWKAYKHASDLRVAVLKSPKVKAEQFAVLVRDIPPIPKDSSRKEQVDTYFREIYPETYCNSMVVTDNKKIDKIYRELKDCKNKLIRAETIYANSKKESNPEGVRPTIRLGFLGLVGERVDSMKYYTEKISGLTQELEYAQKVTLRDAQQASALVFFKDKVSAASAAQCVHAPLVDTWTMVDAPEPRQLLWKNLPTTFYKRELRRYIVYAIVFLTIFFYMIPIGLISALTTLPNLKRLFPFLKPILDHEAVKIVLEAYIPQLVLIVFKAFLPKFLLFLSKAEGIPSQSHAVRAASGKYFYFSVLNVFIGFTVGGTLFDSLKDIQENPNTLIEKLATSIPGNATFFLSFVAFEFFVCYGLELSRIVPLIKFHLKRKFLCKTKAELEAAWYPRGLKYVTRVPNDLLILTIVLCYSVIAPLIIPFGAIYFGLGWLIYRNQILKVYIPPYESYGKMWPHMQARILAALLLFQLTMFGYLGIKKFYYCTPVLLPLPIMSLVFAFICHKKFYRFFKTTVLEIAKHETKKTPDMELVFKSFIPPSLNTDICDLGLIEDMIAEV